MVFTVLAYNHPRLAVAGSVSHGIAIVSTIFRLVYRGWTRRVWWEDAWAAFSLISDVFCLAYMWINPSTISFPTWAFAVALTCVLWAARMSIIFSIIRVANHSGHKIHKWITHLIAVSFACMWVALLAQKIYVCAVQACQMAEPVALSQLITDVISDCLLVAAPLQLWKNVGLSRSRKILVLSSFGASLLITGITIPHSVILFHPLSETTLIFAHVKAALSLVICNLLVIVTFVYRVFSKETVDLDQSFTCPGIFSSVIMQFPMSTYTRTSLSEQEGATSRQITTVQSEAMKPKMEDASMLNAEEGTNTEGWPETLKDGDSRTTIDLEGSRQA
ncbi:uncharacterized protein EDB91DRAFT_330028 [Suillus paluster]|uniref:uncharacterized protein n=1 Tax=Suillus paluster TaxID=48578 RepID=UPI001B86D49B|nr:uncharacterized protein EDB91DRAFT_330028 [Suillus paluster]KAG1741458.1 hypothetical protein EDB91DRAFT_330028 [Suillus paluster]